MPLYLVKRTDKYDYEETISAVVEAKSAADARQVAKGARGDQAPAVWDAAEVTRLGSADPKVAHGAILHTDYNAG